MKRNFTPFFFSILLLGSFTATAQIQENFNTRDLLLPHQVKGYLQDRCWVFTGIDVTGTQVIEGDGSLITTTDALNGYSSIYTPVLDVPGNITITFNYAVTTSFAPGEKKIISVYLTDEYFTKAGEPIEVKEITNAVAGEVYSISFSKFPVGSGPYRVLVHIESENGSSQLIIDEFTTDAPQYYLTGCSAAPVAIPDEFSGTKDYTASGDVTVNDYDPNSLGFTSYLTRNSDHGNVDLLPDGTFTFTANPGFTGSSTTFYYQICNWGSPELCSEEVMVVITFPGGQTLPVSLINFQATFDEATKAVSLIWTTNFEQNNERFDIERSFNGLEWEVVGSVPGAHTSGNVINYSFSDKVSKVAMARNDLYYRLKQVDTDGKFSYTKILIVRVYNTKNINSISVTPNPVQNDINVSLSMNQDAFASFKVYNASGVEMLRKTGKLKTGQQNFILEGSSQLTPGMYFLEVIVNGKERMIVKLLKE